MNLPPEIMQIICEFIASDVGHKKDLNLFNFILTNRASSLFMPYLWSNPTIQNHKQLVKLIEGCLISCNKPLKYPMGPFVYRLDLSGIALKEPADTDLILSIIKSPIHINIIRYFS